MSEQPQPIVSPDGRWWWDGHTWRPVSAPPMPHPMYGQVPGPMPSPMPGPNPYAPAGTVKPRSRKVLYIVLSVVAAFLLLVGSLVGGGVWLLSQGNPSPLDKMQISFAYYPDASDFWTTTADGQTTIHFVVRVGQQRLGDDQLLLERSQKLQALVNRAAPSFDGPIEIRFRGAPRQFRTVTFHAHDTLDLSTISSQ